MAGVKIDLENLEHKLSFAKVMIKWNENLSRKFLLLQGAGEA